MGDERNHYLQFGMGPYYIRRRAVPRVRALVQSSAYHAHGHDIGNGRNCFFRRFQYNTITPQALVVQTPPLCSLRDPVDIESVDDYHIRRVSGA